MLRRKVEQTAHEMRNQLTTLTAVGPQGVRGRPGRLRLRRPARAEGSGPARSSRSWCGWCPKSASARPGCGPAAWPRRPGAQSATCASTTPSRTTASTSSSSTTRCASSTWGPSATWSSTSCATRDRPSSTTRATSCCGWRPGTATPPCRWWTTGRAFDTLVGRIFDEHVSTKDDGMGVALSIAKATVEAHGGTLTVRTRAGTGTTSPCACPGPRDPGQQRDRGAAAARPRRRRRPHQLVLGGERVHHERRELLQALRSCGPAGAGVLVSRTGAPIAWAGETAPQGQVPQMGWSRNHAVAPMKKPCSSAETLETAPPAEVLVERRCVVEHSLHVRHRTRIPHRQPRLLLNADAREKHRPHARHHSRPSCSGPR